MGTWNERSSKWKCTKCGSKKHETKECSVDLSKVRCFRCSQHGHVGVNCSNRSGSGVSKGSPKVKESTGKGKESPKEINGRKVSQAERKITKERRVNSMKRQRSGTLRSPGGGMTMIGGVQKVGRIQE